MDSIKINSQFAGIKTGILNYDESTIKSLLECNSPQNFCQIIPTGKAAGPMHVFTALESALDAVKNKTGFSGKPQLEFLIRFFGTKQLDKALKKTEFEKGKNAAVLVCAAKTKTELTALFKKAEKNLGFTEKKIVLGKNKKELMALYKISENELKTLKDLKNPLEATVIEKNSLVVFET